MKGVFFRNINLVKKVEILGEKVLYFLMEYYYESCLGRYKVFCCYCNIDCFFFELIIISLVLLNFYVCLCCGDECICIY